MAAAYALDPRIFNCSETMAWIGRDNRLNNVWFHDPPAIQVGPKRTRPDDPEVWRHVVYCPNASGELHDQVMQRLTDSPFRSDS